MSRKRLTPFFLHCCTGKKKIIVILSAILAVCFIKYKGLLFWKNAQAVCVSLVKDDTPRCRGFDIEPYDPSIKMYIKKQPPITCHGLPNILYSELHTKNGGNGSFSLLKVNKTKTLLLKLKYDMCRYQSLKMTLGSDFKVNTSGWSVPFTDSIKIPENITYLYGQCLFNDTLVGFGYVTVVRKDPHVEETLKKRYKAHVEETKPKETLSIMLIGVDGTSKPNFVRHMPKTKKFLLEEMGAIELYRVNKIGLNTFPNVVPMLTGLSEIEVLKNWNFNIPMDEIDHLFLWDNALKAGYRTGVVLDSIDMTSFHYLKKGWHTPQFHYYNRPIVIKNTRDKTTGGSPCAGDTPQINLYLDHYIEIARLYKNNKTTPYFLYAFMCILTHHKLNPDRSADDVYRGIFQTFRDENLLNNTLVVFFSDHGTRMGPYRRTLKGMLEDSNPFMFFIFPPWFKDKYRNIMANFLGNQKSVITNFDIHATLKDVLYFRGDELLNTPGTPNKTQGISLFRDIPAKRTCDEAGIPVEFCNCREFNDNANILNTTLKLLEDKFIEAIQNKTLKFRDRCIKLRINSTISTLNLVVQSSNYYQMTIRTEPGGAVYQAILSLTMKGSSVSIGKYIDRLNLYRGQADCVDSLLIRPFCFCANLLTASGQVKVIDQSEAAEFGIHRNK